MNIEINGATLQADFMDADFMEIFEPELYKVQDGVNNCKAMKDCSVAARYKELNRCVEDFFDAVWGTGTSGTIFEGSNHVMRHLEALGEINAAFKAENKQLSDASNKYAQRQYKNGFYSGQRHQGKRNKEKPRNGRT